MMKNCIILFLIAFASYNVSFGQIELPDVSQDLSTFELIGNVRYLEQIEYSAIDLFGDVKKDSFQFKFHCNFDSSGNLISYDGYNFHRNKEKFSGSYIWKYNNDGNPIQFLEKNINGKLLKSNYFYDSNKRLIECEHFDDQNRLYGKEKYKYDEIGNYTESKTYGEDGALDDVYVLTYNSKGNCIQKELIYNGSYLAKKYTFKYDIKGNLIEEYLIDKGSGSSYPSGNRRKMTIEYNLVGKKIKTSYYKAIGDNSLKLLEEVMYNEMEQVASSNFYSNSFNSKLDDNKPTIFLYEYTYDSPGNWIKKVEFVNYVPIKIIERSINYF